MRPIAVTVFLTGALWTAGVVTAWSWGAAISVTHWASLTGLGVLMASPALALLDRRMAKNRAATLLKVPRMLKFPPGRNGSRPLSPTIPVRPTAERWPPASRSTKEPPPAATDSRPANASPSRETRWGGSTSARTEAEGRSTGSISSGETPKRRGSGSRRSGRRRD